MALLTDNDVLNVRFQAPASVETGYDLDQVDLFLDEVAETIAQLTKQKTELENELKKAQARILELENASSADASAATPDNATTTASFVAAPATDTASEATALIALAQQVHDKYISDGKAESERLVADATAEGKRIVTDAEEQYNRTLTQLEQERSLLDRKISDLRDFERDYRTRLKSYLESLLSDVENKGSQSEQA